MNIPIWINGYTGTYGHNLANKRAEIDLSTCVFVTAGLGVTF